MRAQYDVLSGRVSSCILQLATITCVGAAIWAGLRILVEQESWYHRVDGFGLSLLAVDAAVTYRISSFCLEQKNEVSLSCIKIACGHSSDGVAIGCDANPGGIQYIGPPQSVPPSKISKQKRLDM